MRWAQSAVRFAALALFLLVGAEDNDARAANGINLGPRQPDSLISSGVTVAAANQAVVHAPRMMAQVVPSCPGGSLSGLFNRGGMLAGFAAGFLGAGILGLLFGHGISAELNGVPSYLGLIFQLALWLMLGRLIWTRWRSDNALSSAGLTPGQLAAPYLRSRDDLYASIEPFVDDEDMAEEDGSPSVRSSKVAEPRGGRE
jgi:hypothetical protein